MGYGKAKKANTTKTKKTMSTSNKVRTFLGMAALPEASAKTKEARDIGYVGSKKKKKGY